MKVTKRQLRRLIREAMDSYIPSDEEIEQSAVDMGPGSAAEAESVLADVDITYGGDYYAAGEDDAMRYGNKLLAPYRSKMNPASWDEYELGFRAGMQSVRSNPRHAFDD